MEAELEEKRKARQTASAMKQRLEGQLEDTNRINEESKRVLA